ncbi:MAG: glycosyltransferase family 39 protein [bacterium]
MQNQSPRRKLTEVLRNSTGERVLIYLLVSLSAALRIVYFFQVRNNPFLNHPRLDALFHDLWGLSIAHGNFVGDQVFFRAPLYPYILGFIYWIFGHEYLMVRIVQHLLGIASVVLVYQIGKRWFDTRTALLAAFLTAVNPMLLYFEGQLLFESFLTFLILLWLFVLSMAIIRRKLLYWFLAGIVLGLLAITRPPVLAAGLVTLLIVGVRTFRKPDIQNWLRPFFALSIGLLLMILPVGGFFWFHKHKKRS